jgi:ABC-type Co2+ transport system permease subunit
MSTPYPSLASGARGGHPSVLSVRVRERLLLGLTGLIPLILALAISIAMPTPSSKSVIEVIGIAVGVAGVGMLIASTRYALTVALLALYLGLLDGPVKLELANKLSSGFRDVLIAAIGLGMLLRLTAGKERTRLAPLGGWVVAFVAVVIVQALNPGTSGILKVLGGYRQQLEFVPLFFFGYVVVRSKLRFRQMFLILGVIALANGLVGAYQSRLSPGGLAAWGPGYGEDVSGKGLGRTYSTEGVSHPRPPALGSDSGFGGGVGVLALPGLLALLTAGRLRRRWPVLLCCFGALLGIATAASRTSVIIGVVVLVSFAVLSLVAGLRVSRPLAGLMAVVILGGGVAYALIAADGSEVFARQESLASLEPGQEKGGDGKEKHLSEIPKDLTHAPFGLGLGIEGSAGGFGGHEKVTIENEKVSGGSAYNLLALEVGAPGLLLWVGLSLSVIMLGLRYLRRIVDPELRTYLVAVLAVFIGFTVQGFVGTTLVVTPAGAYLWFAPGVIAFWFLGPGRAAMASPTMPAMTAASAAAA